MVKKIFITGMGGLAGRALVKLALSKKYLVGGTVYKTFPQDLEKYIQNEQLKPYQTNLLRASRVKIILADFQPDIVIHFAGRALSRFDSQILNTEIYSENISIFNNVLAAIKSLKRIPKFILTSGCLVYDKAIDKKFRKEILPQELSGISPEQEPYRASRLDQEKLLSKEDIDYIITRPTQFTGPGKIPGVIEWYLANQISQILTGRTKEIILRNKLSEIDLLDVRDVARAYLALLEKGLSGEVYHINSGSPITVENLAKVFLEIAGINSSTIAIKSSDREQTVHFRFSPKKINQLGWFPKLSVKDSLLNYWTYYKSQDHLI